MTPIEFETRIAELVGHRLARVRYHEIAYKDESGALLAEPEWNRRPEFDSLDHGLDLEVAGGTVFHVTWGAEFAQYGVSIRSAPASDVESTRVWDVTAKSRWTRLIDRSITSTCTYWKFGSLADGSRQWRWPQDIRLVFDTGDCVYISAFEVWSDGRCTEMGDHITVFFDGETLERYGAGPVEMPA